MKPKFYPLCFRPIFQRYMWGGHRLRTLLGKPIGPEPCAESWEICDRATHQSLVSEGPLTGWSLHQLIQEYAHDLLGPEAEKLLESTASGGRRGRFPLLVKFLDAAQTLSVQVHPSDAQAARWNLPDSGKTEAWIVLAAEPGSVIYAGFKPGVHRRDLIEAIQQGICAELLHRFEPRPGDCVFLPPGTVHALGAGLLVAEIQQNSDTTFRLYDWGRVGPDGKPRPLHIEQALAVLNFEQGPVFPQTPQPLAQKEVEKLVECPYFTIHRWRIDQPHILAGDGRCHILLFLEGRAGVEDELARVFGPGGSVLIPACIGPVSIIPKTDQVTLLDVFIR